MSFFRHNSGSMLRSGSRQTLRVIANICLIGGALLFASGCSDLKMVNAPTVDEEDRSDVIKMTGITADLTSSGTIQRRVKASSGSFSESRGLLTMNDVSVDSFDEKGVKQGATRARLGLSYFQDSGKRTRGDIEFTTDVIHTSPDKTDPTTNAVEMKSDHILWNDKEQMYESLRAYEMQIRAKGRPPLILRGSVFRTTADMLNWFVVGGAMTTERDKDLQAERERLRSEMWEIAARADVVNEQIAEQNKNRQKMTTEMLPPELRGTPEPLESGERPIEPTTTTLTNTTTTGGRQIARIPPRAASQTLPSAEVPATTSTAGTRQVARLNQTPPRSSSAMTDRGADFTTASERTARIPMPGSRRRPLVRTTTGTAVRRPRAQTGRE